LTSSEVAIAKRLGITPEAYAREKMKEEERRNG
jgi:phage I-like protein